MTTRLTRLRNIETGQSFCAYDDHFTSWDSLKAEIAWEFQERQESEIDVTEMAVDEDLSVDVITIAGQPFAYIDRGYGVTLEDARRAAGLDKPTVAAAINDIRKDLATIMDAG